MMKQFALASALVAASACTSFMADNEGASAWAMIDDFESDTPLTDWVAVDAENDTDPFVPEPQINEVRVWAPTGDRYLMRKPAADGIVGNRKAITFTALPNPIETGAVYTLYARINVESFPNNHSFGLSNLPTDQIAQTHYDSFEPMVRITDKYESNGDKNDGTLMVLSGAKSYKKIINPETGAAADPLEPGTWYELWAVIDNRPRDAGGQRYDLYVQGGEFAQQTLVFEGADFRMQREAPLLHFMTICNTGPKRSPYGNGGVRYDDLYLANGTVLSRPVRPKLTHFSIIGSCARCAITE